MEHWKTDMARETDSSIPIPEQAAHWWVILHSEGASGADHREFGEWVARSPERVEAYLQTARLMRALKSPAVRWPDTPAELLIREAKASAPEPLRLPNIGAMSASPAELSRTQAPGSGPRRPGVDPRSGFQLRGRMLWGAAMALPACLALGWLFFTGPQVYQTRFGEQRSILLDDGSRITLNTASRIDVGFRKDRRFVRLLQGEALFEVARDPARPFDVQAGNTVLRALGTQFNVEISPTRTTVTVVEGRVAVVHESDALIPSLAPAAATSPDGTGASPTLPPTATRPGVLILAAAERVVITAAGTSAPQHLSSAMAAASWTQRQLVFDNRPLSEVAEEFNRYSRERIVINSPELREQQVTGVFQLNDPASFLAFLSGIPGVEISRAADGTRVVTAHDPLSGAKHREAPPAPATPGSPSE
jgi:transmembrane sensor